jgi:hypothetical protein
MAIGSLYNVFLALGYSFIVQNNSFSFLQYRNQKTQGTAVTCRRPCGRVGDHRQLHIIPALSLNSHRTLAGNKNLLFYLPAGRQVR